MVSVSLFVFFVLSHLSLLHSVEEEKRETTKLFALSM